MKATLFGLLALIFGSFAGISWILVRRDEFLVVPIHLGIAAFSAMLFLGASLLQGRKIQSGKFRGGELQQSTPHDANNYAGKARSYKLLQLQFWKQKILPPLGIGTVFVASAIGVIYLTTHELFRFDLTEQRVYSLSEESIAALKALPEGEITATVIEVGGNIEFKSKELLQQLAQQKIRPFSWVLVDPERSPRKIEELHVKSPRTVILSFKGAGSVGKTDGKLVNVEPVKSDMGEADTVQAEKVRAREVRIEGGFQEVDLIAALKKLVAPESETGNIAPRGFRPSKVIIAERSFSLLFMLFTVLLPEVILIAGVVVWWRRKYNSQLNSQLKIGVLIS